MFIEAHNLENETGQVQRVAKRFALIAAAGELATEAGITGWKHLEATRAAGVCFKSWRSTWTPAGSREDEKAIEQVRGFIQRHAARFLSADNRTPQNCAGVARAKEHWIYPPVFKDEACNGLRLRTVTTALLNAGFMTTDNDSKSACRRTIEGERQRVYVIPDSILGGGDND